MSLALYRKYRPGRFAEVIGQDHVTVPLSRALNTGRIHHAYLFTGPRGCGKTSSARIMARSITCQAGPTSDPCGTCQSCIDLAPNGPGSIDVIEIDAFGQSQNKFPYLVINSSLPVVTYTQTQTYSDGLASAKTW